MVSYLMKQITEKMLLKLSSHFSDWYGYLIPMNLMEEFAETVSYDDIRECDTITRESLASFIGEKIVGRGWPTFGEGKVYSEKFFKELNEKAPKFNVKIPQGK
jgi:hypothetical protein